MVVVVVVKVVVAVFVFIVVALVNVVCFVIVFSAVVIVINVVFVIIAVDNAIAHVLDVGCRYNSNPSAGVYWSSDNHLSDVHPAFLRLIGVLLKLPIYSSIIA